MFVQCTQLGGRQVHRGMHCGGSLLETLHARQCLTVVSRLFVASSGKLSHHRRVLSSLFDIHHSARVRARPVRPSSTSCSAHVTQLTTLFIAGCKQLSSRRRSMNRTVQRSGLDWTPHKASLSR